MNFLKRLLWHADKLYAKDGSTAERLTANHQGHTIQVIRHDRDDSQVTLAIDGKMIPRVMRMDEVDDSIEVNI